MTYIDTSWDDAFDYAMSIISRPTPAQEWLASLEVPDAERPDEVCTICGRPNCDGPHRCPECGDDCLYPCRCIDELPGHCDMEARDDITESKRYEDAYGSRD